jgi:hypothetical protein
MDERGRGETAKHGYGVTLYDPKVRASILQFNPVAHGSGRNHPHFLQRPVAGKDLK